MAQALASTPRLGHSAVRCLLSHALLAASWISVCSPGSAEVWNSEPGRKWRPAIPQPGTRTGFHELSATQIPGLRFTNSVGAEMVLNNQILENGAGVALGDVDGDDRCDIYFCGSEPANALFRNLGDWRFEDITTSAGVACAGQFSTGAALADVDGDRDLDLLVNGLGVGTRLFRNDGRGHFTEDLNSGLQRQSAATSLALADADGDGDLDLYVATYRTLSARSEVPPPRIEVRRSQGRLTVTPGDRFIAFALADGQAEIAEKGEPDAFYLNDGHGRFRQVPWTGGAFADSEGRSISAAPEDWGLSVLFRDLNGDGRPDLYVCNDFFRSRDNFWLNDGHGRFRSASPFAWRAMSLSSMATDAADLDRDGHDDFIVAEMLSRDHATRHRQRANAFRPVQALPFHEPAYQPELPRNTLFRSRGDGSFAEIAFYAGLAAGDWAWNVAFLDVDLDGYEDVLFATGNAHDVLDLDAQDAVDRAAARGQPVLAFYPPLPQSTLAFRNLGNLTFTNLSLEWGLRSPGVAQGMALGDLDLDGDLDVVLNRLNQAPLLLRNDSPAPRLAVRLRGMAPNTAAVGAKVRISTERRIQSQEFVSGGRYLSDDEDLRVFALPDSATTATIEVVWRNGSRSLVPAAVSNRCYVIDEAESKPTPPPASGHSTVAKGPIFSDESETLGHRHNDPSAPDFSSQPLLPRALNHIGPGVAWIDWNGDGWEDLVLGGGHRTPAAIFLNNQGRRFDPAPSQQPVAENPGGAISLMPWPQSDASGLLALYGPAPSSSVSKYSLSVVPRPPSAPWTQDVNGPACIATADVDADGDLDVFVGLCHIPGRYPMSPEHLFLRNDAGTLIPDPAQAKSLSSVGMVRGALFTDLNQDGLPDLALAVDWGPVRVFLNQRGRLVDSTAALELSLLTGLWSGIATGDFDEDGRMDLAVSNVGLNTRHRLPGPAVWRLDAFDADSDGRLEVLESFRPITSTTFMPWRTRDVLGHQIPAWNSTFPSYRVFGSATTPQLLAQVPTPITTVDVTTMEHIVLLNRGHRFEARPLPPESQFAPGTSLAVADFNGDGHQDLVMTQNSFDFDLDSGRAEAGTGVCLLGDGRGGFRSLSPADSGIRCHAAQRSVATADFDHDGTSDIVVTQFNDRTVLLRNVSALPGIRLRLQGPPGNPAAVGAQVRRVRDSQGIGPCFEIRSTSGGLTADSSVILFPRADSASEVEVRWPGGRTSRHAVAPDVRNLHLPSPN